MGWQGSGQQSAKHFRGGSETPTQLWFSTAFLYHGLDRCWASEHTIDQPFEYLQASAHIYVYIQGVQRTLLSKATYNKNIWQKEEKQQYITVSTVSMFIEGQLG